MGVVYDPKVSSFLRYIGQNLFVDLEDLTLEQLTAMNLMKTNVCDYIVTGSWSKKAYSEAKKFGRVNLTASSADKNFSYIPDCSNLEIDPLSSYVYICENETINGTTYHKLPNTKGVPLVSDQSSMIGLGGLGDFIYQGVSSNNNTLIVAGAIPAAVMAVTAGALIDQLQKRVVPRGLRKEAAK